MKSLDAPVTNAVDTRNRARCQLPAVGSRDAAPAEPARCGLDLATTQVQPQNSELDESCIAIPASNPKTLTRDNWTPMKPPMSGILLSRREWLKASAAAGFLLPAFPTIAALSRATRSYHVCLTPTVVEQDAELLRKIRDAGVSAVWLAGFFYGHQPFPDELLRQARQRLEAEGLEAHLVNVPLGHPGDSLGAKDGNFPLTPPPHWRIGQRPDGGKFAGTSLHEPATAENANALRRLRKLEFSQCFLDDDFRLARGPGEIGGCFCEDHRTAFLRSGGYLPSRWDELLNDVGGRRLTPLLRAWLDFTCDGLSASFRGQRDAFSGELGIMVMYLGSEKAGIRLKDYGQVPFRVGELMFEDKSFTPVKGKTDELFSVLFHRRFVRPELAFSETTAYPSDRLSAANMAAKLVMSTLADVRHTMFMSGLTPFPREHWSLLAPAMRQQARLHAEIAGHRPRGPFKHFWGEAQRLVGEDNPFSLWLANGVPFEVVENPSPEGWNFLSDRDARELAGISTEVRPKFVCRDSAGERPPGAEALGESLPALFAFKNRIKSELQDVPHIEEAEPAVCAWYPTARKVMVWNLSEQPRKLTVADGERKTVLNLGPLEAGTTAVAARDDFQAK